MTKLGNIGNPHALVNAGDVGAIGATTWGDLYTGMEKLRWKGSISIVLAVILFLVGVFFLFKNSVLITGVSLGLAGYYYRNYVGAYGLYAGSIGGRHVVVPNLKVK
jgi:hypothetical protein